MSEEEEIEKFGFSHIIGDVIMNNLVEGETSLYAIDDEAMLLILETVHESLEAGTQNASMMSATVLEVAAFLEAQGGQEAADSLNDMFLTLGALAANRGVELEGYSDVLDSQGEEQARSQSVIGNTHKLTAPKVDEEKPEGAISVKDLMSTRRRI